MINFNRSNLYLLLLFIVFILGFNEMARAQSQGPFWTCQASTPLFNTKTTFGELPTSPVVTQIRNTLWTHEASQYLFAPQQTLFCGVIQISSQDYYFLIKIDSPSFPARPISSSGKLNIISSDVENPSCVLLDFLKERQLAEVLFEEDHLCHLSVEASFW